MLECLFRVLLRRRQYCLLDYVLVSGRIVQKHGGTRFERKADLEATVTNTARPVSSVREAGCLSGHVTARLPEPLLVGMTSDYHMPPPTWLEEALSKPKQVSDIAQNLKKNETC